MSEYTGKICPFCKTEFQEEDEIVVCSNCEMPHHKDCWVENQGCTTFGCTGAIQSVGNGATSVTTNEISYDDAVPAPAAVFCTQCGARNTTAGAFCTQCGARLAVPAASAQPAYNNYAQPQQPAQPAYNNYAQPQQAYNAAPQQPGFHAYTAPAAIDEDVVRLVDTNTQYYLPKFQEMKMQNKKTTWNWMAFLFSPYWLIYRKMYGYGFAALGASLLTVLVPGLSVIVLAGYVALGILGNYLYMTDLEKKAAQVKQMTEPFKSEHIRKVGGTDSKVLIATIIGYAILAILLS